MQLRTVGHLDALKRATCGIPPLEAHEEFALARRAQAGDDAAMEKLVGSHVRLVLSIADQYRRYGTSYDELVSEGLVGLMEAVNRFDPERGTRLAAYAAWWIRALLRRHTLNNRRIVKAPSTRNARKIIANLGTTRRALAQRLGHEPDAEQVARALGVEPEDIDEIDMMFRRPDVPCDTGPAVGAYEPVAPAPSPEALAIASESRGAIDAALRSGLAELAPRERRIVEERALLDPPRKLADLGHELGISRERVRQVERDGYAKLRGRLAVACA